MMSAFRQHVASLQKIVNDFSPEAVAKKADLLHAIAIVKLPVSRSLIEYHHTLLFMAAHPSNEKELNLVKQAFVRIVANCCVRTEKHDALDNSGLPMMRTISSFSYDLLKWAEHEFPGQFSFDSFGNGYQNLSLLLRHTLPDIQKEILTEDGMHGEKLLRTLFRKKKYFHSAVLREASKLDHMPLLRDQLFEAMDMYSLFEPGSDLPSLTYNGFVPEKIHYQHSILKKFDHRELIDRSLPKAKKLDANDRAYLCKVIRTSLLLLGRETEPSTWMDPDSIKLFELEHGISVCIYGMTADHRQPLESYFGFTAFKNGYPMSYGGAWLFGKRALFGMNIFEWFRGGESAFVFAQLLRTYRQCFGIDYFEVEPYQYGKNNPEGILSGAFWFYHRFGFRLLDRKLNALSEDEMKKISSRKDYRTPKEILKKFTKSNIGLHLSGNLTTPLSPAQVRTAVTAMIAGEFKGDTQKATANSVQKLIKATGYRTENTLEKKVLTDLALFVTSSPDAGFYLRKKKEIQRLVQLKVSDEFRFQLLLRKFLK